MNTKTNNSIIGSEPNNDATIFGDDTILNSKLNNIINVIKDVNNENLLPILPSNEVLFNYLSYLTDDNKINFDLNKENNYLLDKKLNKIFFDDFYKEPVNTKSYNKLSKYNVDDYIDHFDKGNYLIKQGYSISYFEENNKNIWFDNIALLGLDYDYKSILHLAMLKYDDSKLDFNIHNLKKLFIYLMEYLNIFDVNIKGETYFERYDNNFNVLLIHGIVERIYQLLSSKSHNISICVSNYIPSVYSGIIDKLKIKYPNRIILLYSSRVYINNEMLENGEYFSNILIDEFKKIGLSYKLIDSYEGCFKEKFNRTLINKKTGITEYNMK